jgi:hypothetical protein
MMRRRVLKDRIVREGVANMAHIAVALFREVVPGVRGRRTQTLDSQSFDSCPWFVEIS